MTQRQHTVAVVDDDPRLLESLENLFESAGYLVRTYASAHALIDDGMADIDCLITDIGMPGMDGFELCEVVRKSYPSISIYLITGRHDLEEQRRERAAQVSGFFRKPFDGAALLKAVAEGLRR